MNWTISSIGFFISRSSYQSLSTLLLVEKVFTSPCTCEYSYPFIYIGINPSPLSPLLASLNMTFNNAEIVLTKDKLLQIIKGLLSTDANLDFLLQLEEGELKSLVACIREGIDQVAR